MNTSHHGFLIHSRKYKETSSIVYIFSSTKGIQSLIFKGSYSNKNKFKFSLFNEYLIAYNDKYNFPYLSKFEISHEFSFDKKYYLLGLYINELLYKTIREGYDFEPIYESYKSFLLNLSSSKYSTKRLALIFEKDLIENLGYGLHLPEHLKILSKSSYTYDLNEGFKQIDSQQNKYSLTGFTLEKFFSNTLTDNNAIDILRLIIHKIIKHHYPDVELMGNKLL